MSFGHASSCVSSGITPVLLLVLEYLFAQLLVAGIEQMHVVDLLHPFLRRVMRRVRGAGRVFDEERLVGLCLVHPVQVVDGVVGHAGDQVPVLLALERINLGRIAEQVRLPLVGVAADEAVEILKAHAGRPLVERSDRTCGEGRRVVVLAEPRSRIAVVEQDPADGGLVLRDNAVVAGESRRLLRDDAEADRMVVASGDQRRPRRRAERGGMDVGVAQAVVGNAVHRRRRDDAAERARHAETGIVRDDQHDIGRLLWRHDSRRPPWLGLESVVLYVTAKLGLRRRQLLAVNGGGCAWRTELALNLDTRRERAAGKAGGKRCRHVE